MSNVVDRASSRKMPVRKDLAYFRPCVTATLANIDSPNLTCAVALATLDRWNIPHSDRVTYLRRSEARNLRREWLGPKGIRVRPAGEGTILFELFDGFLRLDFDAQQTWEEADGWPEPGQVRLTVRCIER